MRGFIFSNNILNSKIWHPFYQWEDYHAGMYDLEFSGCRESAINTCKSILTNKDRFISAGLGLIVDWPKSCEENLSSNTGNPLSWIGWAVCCYSNGIPEFITRKAWGEISGLEKHFANNYARLILNEYKDKNRELHKPLGIQMLF